jgi:hypothetical protein
MMKIVQTLVIAVLGLYIVRGKSVIEKNWLDTIDDDDNENSLQRKLSSNWTELVSRNERSYYKCPPGFTYISATNNCYQLVYQKLSWTNARRNCKRYNSNARLVAIKDKREQNSIISSFFHPRKGTIARDCPVNNSPTYSAVWTSGQRVTTSPQSRDWVWKPDAWYEMEYSSWDTGEPSNHGNAESCLSLHTSSFEWNDENCNVVLCSLCEIVLHWHKLYDKR